MRILLDLCCKAGGCTKGYQKAGFYVVGVDIEPQPHYCGDEFYQDDMFHFLNTVDLSRFDAIHASPPCQAHSIMKARWVKTTDYSERHVDLIPQVRDLLVKSAREFVIENVVGAPLINPMMLCGTMFGLQTDAGNQLLRHRLFELSFYAMNAGECQHNTGSCIGVYGGGQNPARKKPVGVYGHTGGTSTRTGEAEFGIEARRQVMGIEWMTGKELSQAIPPAYTEFIGRQLMAHLEAA
jgi:DNA (cytosine-5)-methyltransferase 1